MFAKGLRISKRKFYDILTNPIYIGKIRTESFEDEAEQTAEGVHEPIITEEVCCSAQAIFLARRKPYKSKTTKDELPLSGHLICPLWGKAMTGSGSTGCSGKVYHCCHCQRKYNYYNNTSASEANEGLIRYLCSFGVCDEVLTLYYRVLEDVFNSGDKAREQEKTKLGT
ncbi:MAG: hypothetical protein HZA79_03070 [Sphingobacteriales bacterium]|nr:hypothetical protein [Sphingobacteriales bacterium]